MLKVIELFAGIGAQAEALSRIGIDYKIIGISEIDKYAIQSYIKLHGNTKNFGDITKIEQLPEADLWTYSFPCTDISMAGKQAGFDIGSGTRSSLLWEVKRLLLKSKETGTLPKYLLMEDVKAIISSKFVDNFNEWLNVLNLLGYKSFYKVLNAIDYGIPQNRERVFVFSILDSNADFEFPKPVISNLKLKDMLEDVIDKKYYLSKKLIKYFTDNKNRNGYVRSKTFRPQTKDANYAFTITTRPGSRASDNFIIEPNLNIECIDVYNRKVSSDVSGTITTRVSDSNCTFIANKKADDNNNKRIRMLTPRECWRLMGWTDSRIDVVLDGTISNTQLYKQAGNSIVVDVLEVVFREMFINQLDRKATKEEPKMLKN